MKLSRVLLTLGLIGLALIAVKNLGQLSALLDALSDVQWYVVPLVVFMQLLSYSSNARYYQAFFSISGDKLSFDRLLKTAMAINFANIAIPSGGISGTTYLAQSLHREVTAGRATLGQLARYAFTILSFMVVLVFGFLLLFFGGGIAKVSVRLTILGLLVVLIVSIVLILLFSERRLLERGLGFIVRFINYTVCTITNRKNEVITRAQLTKFLDELYDGYSEIVRSSKNWPILFGWALAGNIAEIMTLYVVFVSFGVWPNLGAVIAAYAIANAVSLLGVFTGGVGVYEAAMVAALTALGIPFTLSFAVIIIYRGLSMLIFLPLGFIYYRQGLKQ
jgi:uncharacterized protein (TIRG00374 family)